MSYESVIVPPNPQVLVSAQASSNISLSLSEAPGIPLPSITPAKCSLTKVELDLFCQDDVKQCKIMADTLCVSDFYKCSDPKTDCVSRLQDCHASKFGACDTAVGPNCYATCSGTEPSSLADKENVSEDACLRKEENDTAPTTLQEDDHDTIDDDDHDDDEDDDPLRDSEDYCGLDCQDAYGMCLQRVRKSCRTSSPTMEGKWLVDYDCYLGDSKSKRCFVDQAQCNAYCKTVGGFYFDEEDDYDDENEDDFDDDDDTQSLDEFNWYFLEDRPELCSNCIVDHAECQFEAEEACDEIQDADSKDQCIHAAQNTMGCDDTLAVCQDDCIDDSPKPSTCEECDSEHQECLREATDDCEIIHPKLFPGENGLVFVLETCLEQSIKECLDIAETCEGCDIDEAECRSEAVDECQFAKEMVDSLKMNGIFTMDACVRENAQNLGCNHEHQECVSDCIVAE